MLPTLSIITNIILPEIFKKSMICTVKISRNTLNYPRLCKRYLSVCRWCSNNTWTLRNHWPKMTPWYRVDECIADAVTDMVWYHPRWATPLIMILSKCRTLLLEMIKCHWKWQMFWSRSLFWQLSQFVVMKYYYPPCSSWERSFSG